VVQPGAQRGGNQRECAAISFLEKYSIKIE
jgi:hypothetical protein